MKKLALIKCDPEKKLECTEEISKALKTHNWIQLLPPKGERKISSLLSLFMFCIVFIILCINLILVFIIFPRIQFDSIF